MRRIFSLAVVTILGSLLLVNPSAASVPVSGKNCGKLGQVQTYKAKKFTCIKSGRKLVWNKPTTTKSATQSSTSKPASSPAPEPTPTPSPTPTNDLIISPPEKGINIYSGGAGGSAKEEEISFELPVMVQLAPSGSNVKLWIYNPANKKIAAGSSGVFIQSLGEEWKFYPANSDGSFYLTLTSGSHLFDVVEPNPTQYVRKRYSAEIDASGKLSISGIRSNSAGYFTVTVDEKQSTNESKFIPTTPCQVLDRTNNPEMQVGFPKAPGRLPSFGVIKALIIPVDFPDVPGQRSPSQEFTPMTDGMNDFYYKMSGNKVKFNYEVLKDWVRMPVSSTFHNLGTWGKGNVDGYWKMAIKTADPLVDYSKFDVVYVLSPREIPWASIAYGPAGPLNASGIPSNDGPITNITLSGADAWQNLANGSAWRWISHETGHLFGLHDLYVSPGTPTYGTWDLMSNNWSIGAIEINSWNRYLLGWLTDSQINCKSVGEIDALGITQVIDPIERVNDLTKAIVIKLSDSRILVLESRRNEGLDVLTPSQEGTLVYTVDMTIPTIKGGWKVQRRPGSSNPDFTDAALRLGDVINVEGLKIEILAHDQSGDMVKISKP